MTYTILSPPVPGAIPAADFSSHNENDQDRIDWPMLAKYWLSIHPEAIVIVKMGQGDGWYLNPYRYRQRWGAHAAGIKNVLLYWYVEVVCGGGPKVGKGLSGAQNANAFIQAQGDDGGLVSGEGYAGDWEDNALPGTDLAAMAYDFGDTIRRPTGLAPLLYSAEWFAKPHGLERDVRLAQFPLWWASYQKTLPPVPNPWATYGKGISCWQFTDRAVLPGVPFPTDVSWWLAGLPALRNIQWGYQHPPDSDLLVAGRPDISVNAKGEATDITKAAVTIAGNIEKSRRLYLTRGTPLDDLLATTQGDAAAIALVSGLLGS